LCAQWHDVVSSQDSSGCAASGRSRTACGRGSATSGAGAESSGACAIPGTSTAAAADRGAVNDATFASKNCRASSTRAESGEA